MTMKNPRILWLAFLCAVLLVFGLSGCTNGEVKGGGKPTHAQKAENDSKPDKDSSDGNGSDENGSDIQKTAALVLSYLQQEQWNELSPVVHPDQGVRFSPYGYIDSERDLTFTAEQIKQWRTDEETYTWGAYDGSGEPIKLTISGYFNKFVTDHDYEKAPKIAVDQIIGKGNTANNITEVYKEASFIEYHFPGFDAKYEGQDWASLRLVFAKYDGRLYLVGIIHDQWTI